MPVLLPGKIMLSYTGLKKKTKHFRPPSLLKFCTHKGFPWKDNIYIQCVKGSPITGTPCTSLFSKNSKYD